MNPECVATPEQHFIIWLRIWRRQPEDAPCPFCDSLNCEHWDGTGWLNPEQGKVEERKRKIMAGVKI